MTGKFWICVGSLSAALVVGLGAWGAHGLEIWLQNHATQEIPKRLANWKTGVDYQMIHSLGLMVIGMLLQLRGRNGLLNMAAIMILIGCVFFSGMLYGWVLLDSRLMVMLVPLGGLSFIIGWLLLFVASLKMPNSLSAESGSRRRDD